MRWYLENRSIEISTGLTISIICKLRHPNTVINPSLLTNESFINPTLYSTE